MPATPRHATSSPFTYATLDNGMRAVHVASRSDIDIAGVLIAAGSRMDPYDYPGLAHFVEHTIFKGTTHRKAWQINGRMEAIGGELNAFTSKEETCIYTISPGGYLGRAAQLVSELVSEPSFPDRDLDIEREVILDEIDSYLDSLPDAAYDDFEDIFLAGSALGHNILGTRESVRSIGGEVCRSWIERWYTPSRMVAFSSGSIHPGRALAVLNKHFGTLSRPHTPFADSTPPIALPFAKVRHMDGAHQANTVTGVRIGGINDPDRYAVMLLANILGGPGMNSLLNLEMRERSGLVYSVEASVTRYSDCGILALGYGCDPDDAPRCRRVVERTLGKLLPERLTERNIARAKRQYIGQVAVGADNRENATFRAARATLAFGSALTDSEFADIIRRIPPDDLRRVASERLAPSLFSSLTLT